MLKENYRFRFPDGIVQQGENESDDPVKRSSRSSELVDLSGDSGVFKKWWCGVGFEAGVDDEGSAAAPVFVFGEAVEAVNVV